MSDQPEVKPVEKKSRKPAKVESVPAVVKPIKADLKKIYNALVTANTKTYLVCKDSATSINDAFQTPVVSVVTWKSGYTFKPGRLFGAPRIPFTSGDYSTGDFDKGGSGQYLATMGAGLTSSADEARIAASHLLSEIAYGDYISASRLLRFTFLDAILSGMNDVPVNVSVYKRGDDVQPWKSFSWAELSITLKLQYDSQVDTWNKSPDMQKAYPATGHKATERKMRDFGQSNPVDL